MIIQGGAVKGYPAPTIYCATVGTGPEKLLYHSFLTIHSGTMKEGSAVIILDLRQ